MITNKRYQQLLMLATTGKTLNKDATEEYFRKKKKGNDEDTYFPLEESEPPHY